MATSQKTLQEGVMATLLVRIDADAGFAGTDSAARTVGDLIDNDADNKAIAAAILIDPALAINLLKVANSSRYPRGSGNISTIDQILALLGLNTVKTIAGSFSAPNMAPETTQASLFHSEIAASVFCGRLAAAIARSSGAGRSAQEAQICGQMQNLGRLMSIFHINEEIEHSRNLQIEKNLPEQEAVKQVFGMSYEDVGGAIARHWNLPDVLQKSLWPDTLEVPPNEAAASDLIWQQYCALFCRRVTNVIFRMPEGREKIELPRCIDFFRVGLGLDGREAPGIISLCLEEMDGLLEGMGAGYDFEDARNRLRKASERSIDMLSEKDSLVQKEKGQTPIDVIKHLMRLIHEHCSFDCTMICLPSGSGYVSIAGVGRNAGMLTTKFRATGVYRDIFHSVMENKKNVFVDDIYSAENRALFPKWHHEFVKASSCAILPLLHQDKLVGFIYGDYMKQHGSPPAKIMDGVVKDWREKIAATIVAGPKAR